MLIDAPDDGERACGYTEYQTNARRQFQYWLASGPISQAGCTY